MEKGFYACIEDLGMKAIELYPCYHMYKLSDAAVMNFLIWLLIGNFPYIYPVPLKILAEHWLDVEDLSWKNKSTGIMSRTTLL